jgi:hypothetical protein
MLQTIISSVQNGYKWWMIDCPRIFPKELLQTSIFIKKNVCQNSFSANLSIHVTSVL